MPRMLKTNKLWAVDGFQKKENQFFKVVAPDRFATLWCPAPHPRLFGQHKLDLTVKTNRKHGQEVRGGMYLGSVWRKNGGVNMIRHTV